MKKELRLLTIQDYSCLGRCSLTVALPVISACQIECVGVPSAILSNHTAGFSSWTYVDLKDELLKIVTKWDDYKNHFDAIYTGYLPTNQIDVIKQIFLKFKDEDTLIYVDPCFADYGKMYAGFDKSHIDKMKELIRMSDVILPNLSETCFLSDVTYKENLSLDEILSILDKLSTFGVKKIVLSGLRFQKDKLTSLVYDTKNKHYVLASTPFYPYQFHGTGDLFASSYIALVSNGLDDLSALETSQHFIDLAIRKTLEVGEPNICYGVNFESALSVLIDALKERK